LDGFFGTAEARENGYEIWILERQVKFAEKQIACEGVDCDSR